MRLKKRKYKKFQNGGSPLSEFEATIKKQGMSTPGLIAALNKYSNRIIDSEYYRNRDQSVKDAVDFLKRYIKSDQYKSQIGGAPMMRSEIGDEESAMYEKIGAAGDELKFQRVKEGQMGVSRPLNQIGRYLDYRKPVFSTTVDPFEKHELAGTILHELYHTVAEPTNIGVRYMDNVDSRYFGKERTGEVSEFPKGVSAIDRRPIITPYARFDRKSDAAEDISMQKFVVDDDPNKRAPSILYFRNPTELSARTREITNLLQKKGEIPKDQFFLEYDDILKAYEMGNDASKELLYALGVYTSDGSKYVLREDLIPESREKYNMYLRDKL